MSLEQDVQQSASKLPKSRSIHNLTIKQEYC